MQVLLICATVASRAGNCKVVSFLSGGKCGSTALASYLKHAPPEYHVYNPQSGFINAGKELCGRQLQQLHCSTPASTVLDACPRRLTKLRALQTLRVDKNAVGILLIRNQADALLSLYRDVFSSGSVGGQSADEWVLEHKTKQEYNFTAAYDNALQWGYTQIITLTTTQLQLNPLGAVNKIRTAVGMPPVLALQGNTTFNAPLQQSARYRPGKLLYKTKQRVEHYWHDSNMALAQRTAVVI
jgi:hypothetical protein